MLTALWSGLGRTMAQRWAAWLTSPALVFWIGGLLAWVWAHGGYTGAASGWQELDRLWKRTFGTPTVVAQAVLVALALLLVAGTARLAEYGTLGVLRVLEGYWPRWLAPLRNALIAARGRRIDRRAARRRALALDQSQLLPAERAEYATLTARRALVPAAPEDRMPTALGDILRAAESRPQHRYGLNAVACWPSLWLTMPDQARTEVSRARGSLDESARLWLWSLLFAVWTPWTWWALAVALLGMVVGYRMAVASAITYGQLFQTCFALYRTEMYQALGWPAPPSLTAEHASGKALTAYLERGTVPQRPRRRRPRGARTAGSPGWLRHW
ncbi:hypothetical protein ACFZA1_37805 [Streptomyces filipinensis]|uniref:hypothetical protein n=1 Tax=Streptomyces filipinensis TaxID=66887 RepID=UPI0036E1C388